MLSKKSCRFLSRIGRRRKPVVWSNAVQIAQKSGFIELEVNEMIENGFLRFWDTGEKEIAVELTEEGRCAIEERNLQTWVEIRESLSICISLLALVISLLTFMSKATGQEKTEPMPPPQQRTTQAPPTT